ncbi:hypothetical protein V5O48_006726 [Marasmius crinis-equi]|uniref:ChrR-like cupin domain-containing protein n=1 Tax=Marasmius crinis-equi TaxID=585013 RepID=A0ABR3FJ28_9AGAR
MNQYEFHAFTTEPFTSQSREWKTLGPGITQMILNHNPESGRRTCLQKWEPKTSNQIQDAHDYIEEIFIVEGDLRDLKGRKSGVGEIVGDGQVDEGKGEVWTKGSYAYRRPGMEHGPFKSEEGCLMFIVIIPVKGNEKAE